MIDIQRKLKGLPSEELETAKAEDYVFEERVRVIDTLLTFATSSPNEECKRRVEAINALTALCRLQEGKRPRRSKLSASVIKERHLTPPSVLDPASLSDSIPIECEPTQCIFCLGCVALPTETRLKSFHSRYDLKKHFHCKTPSSSPRRSSDRMLSSKVSRCFDKHNALAEPYGVGSQDAHLTVIRPLRADWLHKVLLRSPPYERP